MRYFFIFAMLIASPAFAQFETKDPGAKANPNVYKKGETDIRYIKCHYDMSDLVGDEIYFPKRNRDADGKYEQTMRRRDMYATVGVSEDPRAPKQPYKLAMIESQPCTPYDVLENKFFKIVACKDTGGDYCKIIFMLQDSSGEVFRWMSYEPITDAYLKSYLVKLKSDNVGKSFYLNNRAPETTDGYNILNHTKCVVTQKAKYSCTDLTFINMGYKSGCAQPHFIFKDSVGNEFDVPLTARSGLDFKSFITESEYLAKAAANKKKNDSVDAVFAARAAQSKKEDAQRLKQLEAKFGKPTAKLIMAGQVQIGMSKAACKESWGEPEKVSKTASGVGTFESWFYYGSRYLGFTDGVLKRFSE